MTDTRPAPYPADTRAKGWRFELDYERIEQSGTWAAAMTAALEGLPLARPLLLAMWYAAWKQVPCGSLPADDREMAGAIGIPSSVFAEYRDVLLRGWWLADDGRLYHDTIVRRVIEMMGKRRSDADRKAAERARTLLESSATPAGVTPDTQRTPADVQPESSTDHRPPISQQDKPVERRGKRAASSDIDRPRDVPESAWNDWRAVRKGKRAGPITQTAWAGLQREARKAGLSDAEAVQACCELAWQGFNAGWYAERMAKRSGAAPPTETPYTRHMRERASVLSPGVAAKAPGQPTQLTVIDTDGTQKRIA